MFFVVLLLAPVILMSQNPNRQVNRIYHSVERGEGVVKLGVPGFVARSAFNIARIIENQDNKRNSVDADYYDDSEDLTLQELKPFVKAIKGVKILVVENEKDIPVKKVKKSLSKLKESEIVENLMQVRSEGTNFNIMFTEKKEKIRNLIILVSEEDELVLLNLKMKMSNKQLGELMTMLQKKDAVGKIKEGIDI